MSIAEMFVAINSRIVEMTSEKRDLEERLKSFAAELGCEVWYCELPACGRPFVKVRDHHKFCGKEHKRIYNNKYKR